MIYRIQCGVIYRKSLYAFYTFISWVNLRVHNKDVSQLLILVPSVALRSLTFLL